ncbi:uncharacterized protein VTP21DRAFT_1536 [Calcarisporiella thermophila]|uniref:uncharacterized protein n=1 Tax=Calcarisporiella thermophila TaxID=911321 RepID=UPI00374209D7
MVEINTIPPSPQTTCSPFTPHPPTPIPPNPADTPPNEKRSFSACSDLTATDECTDKIAEQPETTAPIESDADPGHSIPYTWYEGRMYYDDERIKYPLPVDAKEIGRMEIEHKIAKEAFMTPHCAPIAEILEKGGRVLDIGCGAANWILDMAELYPNAKFTGFDISPIFPHGMERDNVEFVCGNALDALPFPDGHFDYVYQRSMVLSYGLEDWSRVMKEVVRITKEGGWVELVETDWEWKKGGATWETFLSPMMKHALKTKGFYTSVAHHLGPLLRAHLSPLPNPNSPSPDTPAISTSSIRFAYKSVPVGPWAGTLSQLSFVDLFSFLSAVRPFLTTILNWSGQEWDEIVRRCKYEGEKSLGYIDWYVAFGCKPAQATITCKEKSDERNTLAEEWLEAIQSEAMSEEAERMENKAGDDLDQLIKRFHAEERQAWWNKNGAGFSESFRLLLPSVSISSHLSSLATKIYTKDDQANKDEPELKSSKALRYSTVRAFLSRRSVSMPSLSRIFFSRQNSAKVDKELERVDSGIAKIDSINEKYAAEKMRKKTRRPVPIKWFGTLRNRKISLTNAKIAKTTAAGADSALASDLLKASDSSCAE